MKSQTRSIKVLEKLPLQISFEGDIDPEDFQEQVVTATPTEPISNGTLKKTLRSATCLADDYNLNPKSVKDGETHKNARI